MDRKLRTTAQLLALAFFMIVGLGVYIYMLNSDIQATRHSIAAVEKDRNSWKSRFDEAEAKTETAAASLTQCTAQVQELQSRIEASAPALPTGKRS